jgi:hypothetical protein
VDDINDIVQFKSGGETSAEPVKAEPVEAPTGEAEQAAATPAAERDEAGRFKAKEAEPAKAEAPEAKPVEKPAEKPSGQLAALLAERAKRQQLEQELAQLRQGQATEKPDIFTDPEKVVQSLVEQKLAPVKQRFFQMSMQAATGKYGQEFEAAAEQFSELADANPALITQLREADDPGEFVYLVGSNTPSFRKAQADKLQQTVSAKDAEIAALKAELEAAKAAQAARNAVPDSLNRQPSGAVPARDTDIEDARSIVRFKSG